MKIPPAAKTVFRFWRKFRYIFNRCFRFAKFYTKPLFLLGLFAPQKRYPETPERHTYGIVICARNERTVIGNLIDSIHAQTYDADKIRIFVVADNCTDDTAEICRRKGCTVYERNDPEHARKGYALQFLFEQIERDYGTESLDGYIVFDADNLLQPNFIEEINKAFDTNAGVVVGYRNTKNFDRNFISAGYGIHFYHAIVQYHRPRTWLNTSTHLAGTGFVIASRLLKDGWHYTCLTEDTQFTLNAIAKGEYIAFCEAAEFFDEQPYEVKVMIRQRMRWIKGRLYAFFSTLPKLFRGIFTNGWRGFACYDMILYAFPTSTYYAFRKVVRQILHPIVKFLVFRLIALIAGNAVLPRTVAASPQKTWHLILWTALAPEIWQWIKKALYSTAVVVREHRHIRCSVPKLIPYILLSPWFDTVGPFLALASLFSTTQWKPIKHDADISIDELTEK